MPNFDDIFGVKPSEERQLLMDRLDELLRLLKLDCRRIIDVFEELQRLPPPLMTRVPDPSAN